mgnify:CR=1 FL=1
MLLQRTKVGLPETEFHLLDLGGQRTPVVVQQALDARSMMRPQLIAADRQNALKLMAAAGDVIAGFWNALEESDDDEEFENIDLDKFVDMEKEYIIECQYFPAFKKWSPIIDKLPAVENIFKNDVKS